MTTIDYQVQLIDFRNTKTKEAVSENHDGSYTIFIDTALSKEAQQKAFMHAMKHILGNDFEKTDISKIERQAHSLELSDEFGITLTREIS